MKKNSPKRKSGSKRGPGGLEHQPQPGVAGPGEPFEPTTLPEERESEDSRRAPRPAPAPGVPVSAERYEWLKKKAKAVRKSPSKHGQQDPSAKK
jgi:hypothetical protein